MSSNHSPALDYIGSLPIVVQDFLEDDAEIFTDPAGNNQTFPQHKLIANRQQFKNDLAASVASAAAAGSPGSAGINANNITEDLVDHGWIRFGPVGGRRLRSRKHKKTHRRRVTRNRKHRSRK